MLPVMVNFFTFPMPAHFRVHLIPLMQMQYVLVIAFYPVDIPCDFLGLSPIDASVVILGCSCPGVHSKL